MSQPIPSMPRPRVFTGHPAEVRAFQLGIPGGTSTLVAALQDGASAARSTTALHPASYSGQRMWGEGVESIRRRLMDHPPWEADNINGLDLVVERERGVALLLTAGDAATGDERYSPQVRYERGVTVKSLVNWHQPDLWHTPDEHDLQLWFLLHHLTGSSLSAELSRPVTILDEGLVGGWEERIILPNTSFDDPDATRRQDDSAPDVDVAVKRRSA